MCECELGFYGNGRTCLEGDCIDSDCPANEQCISPRRSDCECTDGFHRDESGSCVDVDECEETNNCDQNAVCSNTVGTYDCECGTGFFGTGFSCLKGECLDSICPGNQTCESQTYSCGCSEGLKKIGNDCFDIDECSLGIHKCQNNLECINGQGDYACKPFCQEGFENTFAENCRDVNECALNTYNCSSELQCINVDGGFSCNQE